MKYMRCAYNADNQASLTIDAIYQALPTTDVEKASGMVRIVDNEGEDYLYPDHWFEPVSFHVPGSFELPGTSERDF